MKERPAERDLNHQVRLAGNRVHLARFIWILLAGLAIITLVFTIGPYYSLLRTVCASASCPKDQLDATGLENLRQQNLSVDFYANFMQATHLAVVAGNILIGLWIITRLPDDWMALLGSMLFILTGLPSNNVDLNRFGFPFSPSILVFLTFLQAVFLVLFLLLFPDGRFRPRWLGWVMAAWIALNLPRAWPDSILNPARYPILDNFLWFGIIVTALASMIYRYRWVATPLQKQQMKWVVYMLVIFFAFVILFIGFEDPPSGSFLFLLNQAANTVFSILLPLTIANAILRYRLWDIDVVIRRTLFYGLLIALLGTIYLGSVLLLQQLFQRLLLGATVARQNADTSISGIEVVLSTLLVVLLFNPLRQRVQQGVDRRFYRQKYDAERTLEDFNAAITSEVDIEETKHHIVKVVNQTLHPEIVSIWLKK